MRKSSPLFSAGLFVIAVACSILLSSCATIFNGTSQEVRFESEPSGAEIMIDGIERGTTPATITLTKPGLNEKRVTFVKEGYEDRTVVLQKQFATASILNIFGPTFVGFGVDALSGAMFNYSPSQYSVDLREETASRQDARGEEETKTWFTLKNMERTENGEVVVPDHDGPVHVVDTENGYVYTLQ